MRCTIAIIVSLFVTALAWAGEPASLSSSGRVWTNAVLLPSGATIHAGDRVETGPNSTAVISSPSTGRVEVREESSVSVGEAEVMLHEGVVSTSKAAVRLGEVEIEPKASRDALIVVARRGGETLVAAHRGDALISGPGGYSLLLAGGTYAVPAGEESGSSPANEPEPADDDDDGSGAGTVAATTDVVHIVGWVVRSIGSAGTAATVAAIGAAAAGTTAAGFALTEDSPSPSTAP